MLIASLNSEISPLFYHKTIRLKEFFILNCYK